MHRHLPLFCNILPGCLLLCGVACAQTTIHVPGDQPTIQAGIDAAVSGDTVLVADGHYHEHINFKGKNITVTSVHGPAVTIIDGDIGGGPVVRIINNEGSGAVLHGFTVQNGSLYCCDFGRGYEGSGIEILGASPVISGNIIDHNQGPGWGGGIDVQYSAAIIDSNIISNNTVAFFGGTTGAGIYAFGTPVVQISNNTIIGNYGVGFGGGLAAGNATIRNNTIKNNSAQSSGGALWSVGPNDQLVEQNLITGNSAPTGSAIYALNGFHLVNNTIAGNVPNISGVVVGTFTSAMYIANNIIVTSGTENGLLCTYSASEPPVVRFNDVFSSHGVANAYAGDCASFYGTSGNISSDPQFVSSFNFHLLAGSPAIDAGDNSAPNLPPTDFDGNPRIVDGRLTGTPIVDLGIYEFQPTFGMNSAQPSSLAVVNGGVSPFTTFQLSAHFYGTVSLSCPNGLPAGATCQFFPSPSLTLTPGAPVTVRMTISTLPSTPVGTSSVTISASALGIVVPQTQGITLTVNSGTGTTDLSITANSPDLVRIGGPLIVTFTIGNTGQDATGVTFNAFVDRAVSVLASATQGGCPTVAPGHCHLGTIANGASATVTLTVTPGFVRSVTTTGIASSDLSDSVPSNDIQSATAQVRLRPRARK